MSTARSTHLGRPTNLNRISYPRTRFVLQTARAGPISQAGRKMHMTPEPRRITGKVSQTYRIRMERTRSIFGSSMLTQAQLGPMQGCVLARSNPQRASNTPIRFSRSTFQTRIALTNLPLAIQTTSTTFRGRSYRRLRIRLATRLRVAHGTGRGTIRKHRTTAVRKVTCSVTFGVSMQIRQYIR
jgi:hypothetical protein